MRNWALQDITYKIVRDSEYEVAVLPIGSTEPHNLHMPYGSDFIAGERIADRVCKAAYEKGAKVILLPTIPYGVDSNMLEFPLTIHVNPTTHLTIIRDVVRSLEHHGVPKLVLFNSHGGNDFKWIMRELHGQTEVFLSGVEWWKVASDAYGEIFECVGDHGDEMETSVGLELLGELIHLEDADDGAVNTPRIEALEKGWATITRPWHLLTRNSGNGDPKPASAEKGRKVLDIVVERLSNYLLELSGAEMDETFPY